MLQFQAAALLVLDLEMALRPHNLTLKVLVRGIYYSKRPTRTM